MGRRVIRHAAAALVATAAIVAGHALVYALGPTDHAHTHALDAAGHLHWPLPWVAAALVAVVAAAAYGGARSSRHGESSWGWLLPRLAVGQVGGFLLIEAGERLHAGLPVAAMLGEPVIVTGAVVQILAACLTAALLRTSVVLARRLAERRPRPDLPGRSCAVPTQAVTTARRVRPDRAGVTRRGPPVHC